MGFTRWWCLLFVCLFVYLFVCLLPVKFVKSFATWQHLAASGGLSYRLRSARFPTDMSWNWIMKDVLFKVENILFLRWYCGHCGPVARVKTLLQTDSAAVSSLHVKTLKSSSHSQVVCDSITSPRYNYDGCDFWRQIQHDLVRERMQTSYYFPTIFTLISSHDLLLIVQ